MQKTIHRGWAASVAIGLGWLAGALAAFAGMAFGQNVAVVPVLGAQKTLVLPLDVVRDGTILTAAQIKSALQDHPQSVNAYFKAVSYGKAWLDLDVTAPRPIVEPLGLAFDPGCFPSFEQVSAHFTGTDFGRYRRVVVMVHDRYLDQCRTAGFAVSTSLVNPANDSAVHIELIMARDTLVMYPTPQGGSAPRPDDEGMIGSVIAHEMLHGFGIKGQHANAYECGRDVARMDTVGCRQDEYGDPFDVMGYRDQGSHLQALFREKLGWLPQANIREVTATGEFELSPLDLPAVGIQALRVRLPRKIPLRGKRPDSLGAIDYLSIEYRTMTGFDARSPDLREILLSDRQTRVPLTDMQGALIRGVWCRADGNCGPVLLDMHPESLRSYSTRDDFADAMLLKEQSFAVPGNDLRIGVTQVRPGQSITVRVDFDAVPIARQAPVQSPARRVPLFVAGREIGRIEVSADPSHSNLTGVDGTRYPVRFDSDGRATVPALGRGVYFSRALEGGRILIH